MITTLEQGVVLHLVPTSTPHSNFQKISILSHRRDWKFLGGGGLVPSVGEV